MQCIQCPTCNHRAFCKKKYEINKNLHCVIRVLFGEYDDAYRREGTREYLRCMYCCAIMCQPLTESCSHAFMCKLCYLKNREKNRAQRGKRMGSRVVYSCPHCRKTSNPLKGKHQIRKDVDQTLHQCALALFPQEFPSHREGLNEGNEDLEHSALLQRIDRAQHIYKRVEYKAHVSTLFENKDIPRSSWLMCDCNPVDSGPFPAVSYTHLTLPTSVGV